MLRASVADKIMKLAYLTICWTLFTELCPDYQVYSDGEGNQVVTSVYAYYTRLMSAARPFTGERIYPISLCAKFMEGMDPRLVAGFRRNFPTHSTVQALTANYQRKKLQDMLIASQRADDDLTSVQRAVRDQ